MKQELNAEVQELMRERGGDKTTRRHLLTLLRKEVERKKRTEMKVKLEETPGGRDTAKNIVRNDKEKNEKKQVQ